MHADVTTIGFTKTNAKGFFDRLLSSSVKVLYDVRLHNTSQLAGFAKADDLAYFLEMIGSIKYQHQPMLATTDAMLKAFKRDKGDWNEYERNFIALMEERKIEARFSPSLFQGACLLCSEATPHYCQRRLVCEYLNGKWDGALKVRAAQFKGSRRNSLTLVSLRRSKRSRKRRCGGETSELANPLR